jgi:hypothetical protein
MASRVQQLTAPDLARGPGLGVGCCGALAPDDVVRDELDSWPGVQVHAVDVFTGRIVVTLEEDAPEVEELLDALHDRGIEAHAAG